MNILIPALYVLNVLVCLLLVGVILLQRTKGAGGGVSFGGGMGEAVFGAQMGNVLSKSTVILGILFLLNTVLLAFLVPRQHRTSGSLMDEPAPAPAPAEAAADAPYAPEPAPEAAPVEAPAETPAAEAPAPEAPAAPAAAAPAAP